MRNSREKWKQTEFKRRKKYTVCKKEKTVKTYSIEQLSVLHKVEMSEEVARTRDWITAGGDARADFTPLQRHSSFVSSSDSYNPRYASVFRKTVHFLHVHFLSYKLASFCRSLHVCRAKPTGVYLPTELAPDGNARRKIWSPSDMFFFSCLFLKPKVLQLQVLCLT